MWWKTADWVIDLGPDGGTRREIVAEGLRRTSHLRTIYTGNTQERIAAGNVTILLPAYPGVCLKMWPNGGVQIVFAGCINSVDWIRNVRLRV